jgi:hypothetical protein
MSSMLHQLRSEILLLILPMVFAVPPLGERLLSSYLIFYIDIKTLSLIENRKLEVG